jgi:protein TonB
VTLRFLLPRPSLLASVAVHAAVFAIGWGTLAPSASPARASVDLGPGPGLGFEPFSDVPPEEPADSAVPVEVELPRLVDPVEPVPEAVDPPEDAPVSASAPALPDLPGPASVGPVRVRSTTKPSGRTSGGASSAPASGVPGGGARGGGTGFLPSENLPGAYARPEYPASARLRGIQGVVTLLLRVGASGLVEDVRVERSSGDASLDASAVGTAWTWRYRPASVDGVPVAETLRVPVPFRLR